MTNWNANAGSVPIFWYPGSDDSIFPAQDGIDEFTTVFASATTAGTTAPTVMADTIIDGLGHAVDCSATRVMMAYVLDTSSSIDLEDYECEEYDDDEEGGVMVYAAVIICLAGIGAFVFFFFL